MNAFEWSQVPQIVTALVTAIGGVAATPWIRGRFDRRRRLLSRVKQLAGREIQEPFSTDDESVVAAIRELRKEAAFELAFGVRVSPALREELAAFALETRGGDFSTLVRELGLRFREPTLSLFWLRGLFRFYRVAGYAYQAIAIGLWFIACWQLLEVQRGHSSLGGVYFFLATALIVFGMSRIFQTTASTFGRHTDFAAWRERRPGRSSEGRSLGEVSSGLEQLAEGTAERAAV